MGRPTLIQEKKHPYYFKPRNPAESPPDFSRADAPEPAYPAGGVSVPEFLIEQVMEGLSDACILIDRGDRMVYVNSAAKTMLQPKGRILGRKLTSILADAQLSTLACEAYQTGKPLFSTLTLQFPGIRWRDIHQFHASIVPLWIASTRRLVRIALRDAGAQQETKKTPCAEMRCFRCETRLVFYRGIWKICSTG